MTERSKQKYLSEVEIKVLRKMVDERSSKCSLAVIAAALQSDNKDNVVTKEFIRMKGPELIEEELKGDDEQKVASIL